MNNIFKQKSNKSNFIYFLRNILHKNFGKTIVLLVSGLITTVTLFVSILPTNPNLQTISSGFNKIFGQTINQGDRKIGGGVSCKPNSIEKAKVVRGVDGDTIEVSGYCNSTVRFLYIDTPETVKANTPVQCYGPEASKHTKESMQPNAEIFIRTDKESIDRYGRSLGLIFNNQEDAIAGRIEKSFNYELVEKGYAKAKFYAPNTAYRNEMIKGETIARNNNLGLWSTCPIQ
jgi:micrococcal nuclease